MQHIKRSITVFFLLASFYAGAQNQYTFDKVNTDSYALYEKGDWKQLLAYGREAIRNKQDFPLLRLRLGYAAFMRNNFSEALKQYDVVLKNDAYNAVARYYTYLCRKYLNQRELADHEMKYLSKEVLQQEKLHPFALTSAGVELSLKQTTLLARGNPFYGRLDIGNRFSRNVHMQQSVAMYTQKINEPSLPAIQNNNNIPINQFEYYNRLMLNFDRHWQFKAAYHFLYTPFNNFTYYNHIFLAGIKYSGNYFDFQLNANFGQLTDSSLQQYDAQLGLYPLGNLNLYFFSTATLRASQQSAFNFREVVGGKITKRLWLEANATLGHFRNLLENDALYVYNSIDPNIFKGGLTAYVPLSQKLVAQLGYTYEKKQLFNTLINFNQHSITGGLTWKW